jgi:hypothetical protein
MRDALGRCYHEAAANRRKTHKTVKIRNYFRVFLRQIKAPQLRHA